LRYLWKFVHNAVVHPLMAFPWEFAWVIKAHDWTASKMEPAVEVPRLRLQWEPRPLLPGIRESVEDSR